MTDPLRVTEEPGTEAVLTENDNTGVSLENNTYTIEEFTWTFLELACALKRPMDNNWDLQDMGDNIQSSRT